MKRIRPNTPKSLLLIPLTTFMIACGDGSSSGDRASPSGPVEPAFTYNAEIVWTEFGIPHITAQDWGSLGYGSAYAYAQQNYCVAMKSIVIFSGESARYRARFGVKGDSER